MQFHMKEYGSAARNATRIPLVLCAATPLVARYHGVLAQYVHAKLNVLLLLKPVIMHQKQSTVPVSDHVKNSSKFRACRQYRDNKGFQAA